MNLNQGGILAVSMAVLLVVMSMPVVSAFDDPFVVGGIVTNDGSLLVDHNITVTNIETGDSWITTTNETGFYEMVVGRNTLNNGTVVYPNGVAVGDTIRIELSYNSSVYYVEVIADGGFGETVDIEIGDAQVDEGEMIIGSSTSVFMVLIIIVVLIVSTIYLVMRALKDKGELKSMKKSGGR